MSAVKVLVVDDEEGGRETAAAMFAGLGFEVLQARNAAEALEHLHDHDDIALLFVDVLMPAVRGTELVQTAVRLRPSLRVVFCSGYVRNERLGSFPVLHKPYRLTEFVRIIRAQFAMHLA